MSIFETQHASRVVKLERRYAPLIAGMRFREGHGPQRQRAIRVHTPRSRPVRNKATGQVYESVSGAALDLQTCPQSVRRMIAKGGWEYVTPLHPSAPSGRVGGGE